MKFFSRLLIVAALLTTGSLAFAQQGHGNHDRRGQGHGHNDYRHDGRHDGRRYDNRHRDNRRYDYRRHDDRRYGYRNGYPNHRGPHRWARGHRYYGPTYVVRDYGHRHLRHPPRGYHWVRADNDYLLVAIATGIILDMAIR